MTIRPLLEFIRDIFIMVERPRQKEKGSLAWNLKLLRSPLATVLNWIGYWKKIYLNKVIRIEPWKIFIS